MLPSRALLSIQALLFIAYHGRNGKPIKSQQMAECYRLSSRALEPMLQAMTRAGLLESKQGATGGYSVAKPERTTLADAAQLFCIDIQKKDLLFSDLRPMLISELQLARCALLERLSAKTLAQHVRELAEAGIPPLEDAALDFII